MSGDTYGQDGFIFGVYIILKNATAQLAVAWNIYRWKTIMLNKQRKRLGFEPRTIEIERKCKIAYGIIKPSGSDCPIKVKGSSIIHASYVLSIRDRQMQQLHQQQLEELRNDFALKQSDYQLRIAELELRAQKTQDLEVKIKQLEFQNFTLERNYKHHNCEFEQDELQIDNIELIACRQESKLDDSSIINFQEIIKPQQQEHQLKQLKNQLVDEITAISNGGSHEGALKMLNQLFQYINMLKIQLFRFQERQLEKQKQSKDSQSSKFYDTLQKQSKFMTEHIKRLSADKMKLEKRLSQVQRHSKNLQQKLGRVQAAVSKRGLSLPELGLKIVSPPQQLVHQQEHSLDLNEFIAENLRKANSPVNKNQFGIIKKSKN